MMTDIAAAFLAAKKKYDKGGNALAETLSVGALCLETLHRSATLRRFGMFSGPPKIEYWVAEDGGALSRPYRPDLFIADLNTFREEARDFAEELRLGKSDPARFDRVVYTTVSAFCLCFDVWKPKSRKTPGTFFEVLMASAARVRFPKLAMTKHIPIKDIPVAATADALLDVTGDERDAAETFTGDSVSTDLVLTNPETGKGAVVPLKITTRERIVQPFAHQRILDSAYPGQFASFLACISEVQRDDNTGTVKQICVPGTVALFQKHLSKLNGLYYCDIPVRYARPDLGSVIEVKPLHLLFEDMAAHVG
ncbi:MAG: type II site-specific deoxyribonuclease [Rhodobacteraceae bacterium CG17_big_fil_post_rev_8_21_14_2_50_65_11]|nr:MAG: type II site-specific deoxyribonuclease [Rhodobacteraceae bacterium CG17_big_fil_post_rev_8_21_14_2_50_65_11]